MSRKPNRRTFLKLSTAAASLTASELAHALPNGRRIAIVTDDDSPLDHQCIRAVGDAEAA